MRKFLALASILLASVTFVFGQRVAPEHVPGELLIQLSDNKAIGKLELELQEVDGKETGFNVEKLVSEPMHVWLVSFDDSKIDEESMKLACWKHEMVTVAQYNHIIEQRLTVPTDPNFGSQWQWVNNGGGGGTADSDVDADEAWDITTGGLTATGDTIVVCVIEGGGSNYNHVDLIENHWRNYDEIPGNGIDDDNNGYVDDFNGWNSGGNNGTIGAGGHGTSVSGMIGAKGQNGIGVVGMNWDVKIMQVDMGNIGSGSNPNEANVIAAYTYPLVMRQRYNNSNGAEGAFVVATNASWGIDAADPANAPLWCAFYDTLGKYGILNCGSTTNSALNVDVQGDLPTACPSPYMISVTATDNNDMRTFSGYGQTTIDVGAPGDNIYTTSGSSSYTSTSGTSFAGPLTAGIIALIYSAPCTSMMALANADPEAGANFVRDALFNGVDPKPNLTTETVTGGRVNAFNSLQWVLNNCSGGSCIDAFNLAAGDIIDVEAELSWVSTADSFLFEIREVGAGTWTVDTVLNDTILVDTLLACTDYEYQITNICDGAYGTTSALFSFTTDGCCEAPANILTGSPTNNDVSITFDEVLAAVDYTVFYRPTGTTPWDQATAAGSPYTLTGLDDCTEYEYYIQTNCGAGNFSSGTETFITMGCGACRDLTYCATMGQTSDEWIESIQVGPINNTSGDDNGYGDHTGGSDTLELGMNYNVTLEPGYSGQAFSEYWKIWIDLDHDGAFDDATETVFDSQTAAQNTITGSITMPSTATVGLTRMRVAMKWYSATWDPDLPEPCTATYDYGEIEDYCVYLKNDSGSGVGLEETELRAFEVFPNPTEGVVQIQGIDGTFNLQVVNATGQKVMELPVNGPTQIDMKDLSKGIYFLQLWDNGQLIGAERLIKQ